MNENDEDDDMNAPFAPKMPMNPMISHLELEIAWLRQLLEVRIREMQASGLLPGASDLRPGTVIYPQEVEARLHECDDDASDPTPDEVEAKTRLASIEHRRRQYYEKHTKFDATTPLAFLRQEYQLNDAQYLLFLLVIAPAFNPSFSRLYAFIQNHFERDYPSLSLFIEIFSRDKQAA